MAEIKVKRYKCRECGHEQSIQTNHYGECYSWGSHNACPSCPPYKRPTTWECIEPTPIDAWIPKPWTTVTLKDIVKEKE